MGVMSDLTTWRSMPVLGGPRHGTIYSVEGGILTVSYFEEATRIAYEWRVQKCAHIAHNGRVALLSEWRVVVGDPAVAEQYMALLQLMWAWCGRFDAAATWATVEHRSAEAFVGW